MRMSGLIVGGIIGAAAAMYLTRANRPMLMSNFSQASQSVGKVVEAAKNKIMDMGANRNMNQPVGATGMNAAPSPSVSSMNTSAAASPSMNTSTAPQMSNTSANLGKVEAIVKEDPYVRKQVNEILNDNGRAHQQKQ
jgi:hypothetical protein